MTIKKKDNEKYYLKLYENKYYMSYLDYALFLYNKGNKLKALNVLKTAMANGYYTYILHYFDIFFDVYSFEDIMTKPKEKNEFLFIIGCIVDYLIADGIYTFYEYIYIRYICLKHFNLGKEFNTYFNDYTKEIVKFLIEITEGSEEENKKKIKNYYINNEYFTELYFVCGIMYFYGIEGMLEKNYIKSLQKIKISLKNSEVKSYQRFCYTYLFKIRKKLLNSNNENQLEEEESFEEIKTKLFNMYFEGIRDEKIENLSSSFFYYLSKLYNKKIGNNGDIVMEYIFMNRAVNSKGGGGIGLTSFLIYYRKYKAKKIMEEKNKEEYYEKLKNVEGYLDVEGYGEDGKTCPICYENKKTSLCLPCKHFFCHKCLKRLTVKNCPLCRTIIVMFFNVESKEEDLLLSNG